MVRLPWNEKQTYQLISRPQMWPSGLTLAMSLTLNFQGQILNWLYLCQKWSDCHETKSEHIDWTLGLKCNHQIWPPPPPPYLPHINCFWWWEILRIGENILLCNDSFPKSKMAANYGQQKVSILYLCKRGVPMVVAAKHVCVSLIPFWNYYYWFKHAKTNISKSFISIDGLLGCWRYKLWDT